MSLRSAKGPKGTLAVGGWPKGPFPEKWSFASVQKRLTHAWASREEAWSALLRSGARPIEPLDDLYVRAFVGGTSEAVEVLRQAGVIVHGWAEMGGRIVEGAWVALPTTDPFDALVALGVAGPHYGIGNRAIVRFLVQARAFAKFSVVAGGEDLLVLRMDAKGPEGAKLLADRLLQIAPTLREPSSVLTERLVAGANLTLDWSPG